MTRVEQSAAQGDLAIRFVQNQHIWLADAEFKSDCQHNHQHECCGCDTKKDFHNKNLLAKLYPGFNSLHYTAIGQN